VNIGDMVGAIEAVGVRFPLEGHKLHVWYPDKDRRAKLATQIALLRKHRAEVADFLKTREEILPMPPGVRLVSWTPHDPPVILTRFGVVNDVSMFIQSTLAQLDSILRGRKSLLAHGTARELVGRLEQCGVVVELESTANTK